jgi:hypothetical protein
LINPEARFNTIGGDKSIGSGMLGQGNLLSISAHGMVIRGSDNRVVGNLIGTDITGSGNMGNRFSGVYLDGDASRNVIGPDNMITYNGEGGIEITSVDAQGNVITENSIHDNSTVGIYYNFGDGIPFEIPSSPLIYDFDIETGYAEGSTCSDCVVEIFSTSSADGEIFEGSVQAEQDGNFSFSKEQGFSGPSLTTTSLSPSSNTSEFSLPTMGQRGSVAIQLDNPFPRTRFETKLSGELEDNRIGQNESDLFQSADDLPTILSNEILRTGTKYVKVSFAKAEPVTMLGEENEVGIQWDTSEFSFPPEFEDFITALVDNNVSVTYILTFWDKANHPEGWQPDISRFRTQEEIQRYLEYVRFTVSHFKGRIQYYEIWNEPNNKPPLQWIQVEDYINLVKQTVPVIRQEDPNAKIVVGSIALQYQEDRPYLFSILNSDVMPLVDVITWHPLFGVSPESPEYSSYYYDYPDIVQQIKDAATANGFQGKYRADEVTYRSPDCPWCFPGDFLNTNITAAKYYARAIILHLGMDMDVGIGASSSSRVESFEAVRNLCTLMAGAKPAKFPVEIQGEATNIVSYSFSLSNSDYLVALWTDRVAVDNDPGIETTLTFQDISTSEVIGIDVLYGYQQQLVATTEDGNLIVRDLLVKDYPIILRIKNASSP